MNDRDALAAARDELRAHLEALVGPGPIPRFEEALTHPSFANEMGVPDNQRLEFMGDAVLGLCVSEMLATAYADADEGKLTRMRSALVNGEALAGWGRRVDARARASRSGAARAWAPSASRPTCWPTPTRRWSLRSTSARGLEGARALVREGHRGRAASSSVETLSARDPKSALQERVQARGLPSPTYRVVEVRGRPSRAAVRVEVLVGDARARARRGREQAPRPSARRRAPRSRSSDARGPVGAGTYGAERAKEKERPPGRQEKRIWGSE